jgi:hypothetical protein
MSTATITPIRPSIEVAVRPERPAATPGRQVRLTRRGRLAVLLAALAVTLGVGLWLASGSVASQEAGVVQVEVVTVEPGETLWDIASDATDGDVRAMMQRISDLNTLDSSMLYAGQELRVPLAD